MAPEANAFSSGNVIIDKIRADFPQLASPESTFRIITDGCEEGSIKIMGMTSEQGTDTGFLTCEQVAVLIELANLTGGAVEEPRAEA